MYTPKTLPRILTAFAAMALTASAHADTGLCWIDDVSKHDDGLHVLFSQSRGQMRVFSHADGTRSPVLPDSERALVLADGDHLMLSNTPEDSCTVEAKSVDGIAGLQLVANFCGMGHCDHQSKFEPAHQP